MLLIIKLYILSISSDISSFGIFLIISSSFFYSNLIPQLSVTLGVGKSIFEVIFLSQKKY